MRTNPPEWRPEDATICDPHYLVCGLLDRRLLELTWLQAQGRWRRTYRRLASPRQWIPSVLVGVFLALYAVQIYIALQYTPTYGALDIRRVAPLAMLGILLIKLVGPCVDRKKSGAGFRAVETHHLLGGPYAHEQVRLYRILGHAISIFFTSIFAAVFLRLHVPSWGAALWGAYLGMLFTYLCYTVVAITAFHLPLRTYQWARAAGASGFVAILAYLLWRLAGQAVSNVEVVRALGTEAMLWSETLVGLVLTAPFRLFTQLVIASNWRDIGFWSVPALGLNLLTLICLLKLEVWLKRQSCQRERNEFFPPTVTEDVHSAVSRREVQLSSQPPPWWGGAGPILWRQSKAALRLRSGLSWLLIPLAGSLALGCYLAYDPEQGAIMTIAVTVMLSSVFLPGLLPFDFRGDLQGLAALKMMPLRSRAVVAGQLGLPIAILTSLQLFALAPLLLHDASLAGALGLTTCFLVPTNAIIMGLENVVFLLYPYRLAEFDMQATVRRIVMLMAKFCTVFLAAVLSLVAGLGVILLRHAVSEIPVLGSLSTTLQGPCMVVTQLISLWFVAACVLRTTCWAYDRFDLQADLPA